MLRWLSDYGIVVFYFFVMTGICVSYALLEAALEGQAWWLQRTLPIAAIGGWLVFTKVALWFWERRSVSVGR